MVKKQLYIQYIQTLFSKIVFASLHIEPLMAHNINQQSNKNIKM